MHVNLMELIKEAPIGTSLRSRGGDRYRYQRFIFVKSKKNTVNVFTGWTWKTIDNLTESQEPENIVCTLTPDKVIFKLKKYNDNRKQGYALYNIGSFLSLNLLYNCYTRFSYSQELVHTKDGDICPFAKMEFNWNGKLISPIPKTSQKRYDKWDRDRKDHTNAQSRARYAQQKAEREFRKYEKAGKLEEYPIENVFTIKNAQLRSHALNAIGLEKVLAPYPIKIVNKDVIDGRPYELVDIELPSISIYQWGRTNASTPKWCLYLKMTNPSTGEYHLEGVPRKSDSSWDYIPEETVKGALAWRDGEVPERNRPFGNRSKNTSEWKYIQPTIIT